MEVKTAARAFGTFRFTIPTDGDGEQLKIQSLAVKVGRKTSFFSFLSPPLFGASA